MTRRQARPSKQRNELTPRITLVDELKAIEYVDDDYRLKEIHDTIEEDAFNARQRRRSEILGLLATEAPNCPKHSVKMVCPKCIASSGGRKTTTKYKDRLSSWGKMGGRGKKNGFSLSRQEDDDIIQSEPAQTCYVMHNRTRKGGGETKWPEKMNDSLV